jgi:hypothetical protein
MTRDEWDALTDDAERFAFTVSGVAQADLVTDVWEAIDAAVENGEDLDDFRGRVGDKLEEAWGGEDPPRLEMIFRTGVNQAYNDGREAVFSDPAVKEARPYWRFELIDDGALCDDCAECEDVILPADDPWWDDHRPILHPNCRCSFSALTPQEAADEGADVDEDDLPEDVDVADGFGSDRDDDYDPDTEGYPSEIRDQLDSVLGD